MSKSSQKNSETPAITRAQLFKEQNKLTAVQKELQQMLNNVAQHLNILRVEELQIKSHLIASMKRPREPEPSTSHATTDDEEKINQQKMDLRIPMDLEESE